jgi:Aspartyl/Asparaginyl beta-hydroxylase
MTATSPALPASAPLERSYDTSQLAAELTSLRKRDWGLSRSIGSAGLMDEEQLDWRILPLRAIGGQPDRTDPGGPGLADFADTPYLAAAPYFARLLGGIPARLSCVRLMALGPGARLYEHRDSNLGIPWGRVRLHVPVLTNPGAVTAFDGHEHHWDAGRLWYGDFDRPHYVANRGAEARVHLVIDCVVSVPLLRLFPVAFRDALAWSDVLLSRQPVPLNRFEMEGYRCQFMVPAAFLDWSQDGHGDEDLTAGIDLSEEQLVFTLAGQPMFGLVHVGAGEFQLKGWTDERTIRLVDDASEVRFIVRRGAAVREWVGPAKRESRDAAPRAGADVSRRPAVLS